MSFGADEMYNNALQSYVNSINANTGAEGYKKSLDLAQKGVAATAGGAGREAQKAYRTAGLSKAQAAELAGQRAADAYLQNFETQQSGAAQQLANQAQSTGNVASMQQAEAANRFNRGWTTASNIGQGVAEVGKVIATIASDERLKISANISKGAKECSEDIEKILTKNKGRDYSALLYRRKENG